MIITDSEDLGTQHLQDAAKHRELWLFYPDDNPVRWAGAGVPQLERAGSLRQAVGVAGPAAGGSLAGALGGSRLPLRAAGEQGVDQTMDVHVVQLPKLRAVWDATLQPGGSRKTS